MTMNATIGWSAVFFLSIVAHLFTIKWLNSKEGYDDPWPMVFWCSVSWLPTIPWSLVPLWRLRHHFQSISRADWIRLGVSSVLFNLENIVLWILLQSVPLAVYIICRSSYNIVNPLLVRWYQKKPINRLIWLSIVFLLGSYGFLGAEISDGAEAWIILVIVSTSLMTCACSHILEKYFGSVAESDLKWHIHLVYNLYSGLGFLLFTAPSAYLMTRTDMRSITWGLSCLSGIMFIGFVWSKNEIMGFRSVSGNLIMGGVDLSRRVVSSILAYAVLGEHLSRLLIGANLMMFASSMMIFISIWRTYKEKQLIARLDSMISDADVIELLESTDIQPTENVK